MPAHHLTPTRPPTPPNKLPRLTSARAWNRKLLDEWCFIRKHPCWRLRLRPLGGLVPEAKAAVNTALNDLAVSGVLTRWWPVIYEPETASFGGPIGTEIAHTLFTADSRHVLSHLRKPPGEHRPQGNVDAALRHSAERGRAGRVRARQRMETCRRTSPPSCRHTRGRLQDLAEQIRPLVTSTTVTTAQPSAIVTPWAAVFRNSGQTLRDTATAGHLDRGIHHVLPHLVIFHWNRLGLTATTQAVLSRAAREALLPTADQT